MAAPLVIALWSSFATIALPLVIRVLAAIGLGVATYGGIKTLVDELLALVQSSINAVGADILQWVGFFRVDQFMTIVFSAFVVRLVFMGMTATGAISRMQWRSPGA